MMYVLYGLFVYALYVYLNRLTIRDEHTGKPYLTRYHLIRLKSLKVFLHRIYTADKDRHLHNHPWTACRSYILWGGYREQRDVLGGLYPHPHRDYRRGGVMRLFECDFHRITHVLPNTWTLFVANARSREWGFDVAGKFVDWRTYLGLPEDTQLGD